MKQPSKEVIKSLLIFMRKTSTPRILEERKSKKEAVAKWIDGNRGLMNSKAI